MLNRTGTISGTVSPDTRLNEIIYLIKNISLPAVEPGLIQWAKVSNVISPTKFSAERLEQYEDGVFIDWSVYVLRDIRSTDSVVAAPQGEQNVVSAFANAQGIITHDAFTVPLVVDDEVLLIHPLIAGLSKSADIASFSGGTIADWQAAEQVICTIGAINTIHKIHSLIIDINSLVGNITLQMYINVNGANRRIFPLKTATWSVPGGDAQAIAVINGTWAIGNVLTVTAQSDNAVDNGKNIGYEYILE